MSKVIFTQLKCFLKGDLISLISGIERSRKNEATKEKKEENLGRNLGLKQMIEAERTRNGGKKGYQE